MAHISQDMNQLLMSACGIINILVCVRLVFFNTQYLFYFFALDSSLIDVIVQQ